jgi:N-acetylglucosamine-6-sulfatase
MEGRSFLDILSNPDAPWREALLYEYYWERNFPQTPTMHAIRTAKFKFIRYQGIWDTDELYDIQNDPAEKHNLIEDPKYQKQARQLRQQLFAELERTGGMSMPLSPDRGGSNRLRSPQGSPPGDFPAWFYREPPARKK